MDSLLELDDVRAGYGASDVLKGIDLSVGSGEVVGLLGRNGVGKTTTLRSITGKIDVSSGNILIDGEHIQNQSPNKVYQQGIRMVPEDRALFSSLTVVENLQVPIITNNRPSRSLEELYEFFPRLEERQGVKATNLSGGEQQMLSIARALRSSPKLLLLDEPSEGLAPQIVENVVSIIKQIADEGVTILLVEQNSKLAFDLVDRVYIMEGGEIVVEEDPEILRTKQGILDKYLGVKGDIASD